MFEAQITKLKLIKRQMFGRAELDLLRARLMGTASAVGGPHGYFEFLEAWHD